jgi:L-lactate dehydrogenase complex protein LldG
MVHKFQQSAEAVGAIIKQLSSLDEAGGYLAALAGGGAVTASPLSPELAALCAPLVTGDANPADASLCVSQAVAGVAATGSLLLDLQSVAGRAATALAPIHAVFIDPATIVPDLAALQGRLLQLLAAGGPAYFSLTTGPSRTADIERVLTIGVHGAKELHILLLEGVSDVK